jgi:hypothetical protein
MHLNGGFFMNLKSMLLALSVVGMTTVFASEGEVSIPEGEVAVSETQEAPAETAPADAPASDERPSCGCPN